MIACVCTILPPAYYSNHVKFDPKFPIILNIWILNNLFFVSIGEEILFRGLIQNVFKFWLSHKKWGNHLYILFSSLIFGMAHLKGGLTLSILSTICGIFYGYTYDKTNKILCSAIVHFGLNLVHILLFSYPYAIN